MKFRIARKLNYLKKAHHRHGHGIHSPWLFRLITNVIENKKRLPEYKILLEQRERLSHLIKEKRTDLELQTYGVTILKSAGRKNLFKAVELPFRYGKLLLRLVNEFKPGSILYIGPTFGLNLLYVALSDIRMPVNFSQAGNYFSRICQSTLDDAGIQNVKDYDTAFPVDAEHDFVFINSPHSPGEVETLTNAYLGSTGDYRVMIIRGIHESEQMESIWQEFINNSKVRISLDLFEIGIAIFSEKLQKENFVLKF